MIARLLGWLGRKWHDRLAAAAFERQVNVRFDDEGISAAYPDGTVEVIAWATVERITIETNDSGPWGADVWWLLEGQNCRCAYPQGATGELEALQEYARRFPGFSDTAVVKAMGCTSPARFVCWKRDVAL